MVLQPWSSNGMDLFLNTKYLVFETLSVNSLAWNQEHVLESSWFAVWKRVSKVFDDLKNPVLSSNKEVKNDVQSF